MVGHGGGGGDVGPRLEWWDLSRGRGAAASHQQEIEERRLPPLYSLNFLMLCHSHPNVVDGITLLKLPESVWTPNWEVPLFLVYFFSSPHPTHPNTYQQAQQVVAHKPCVPIVHSRISCLPMQLLQFIVFYVRNLKNVRPQNKSFTNDLRTGSAEQNSHQWNIWGNNV